VRWQREDERSADRQQQCPACTCETHGSSPCTFGAARAGHDRRGSERVRFLEPTVQSTTMQPENPRGLGLVACHCLPHCRVVYAPPLTEDRETRGSGDSKMRQLRGLRGESGIQDAPRDILPQRGLRMTGHVLIVNDDQSMAETLTEAMTRRGFVVTWNTSAADALTLPSRSMSRPCGPRCRVQSSTGGFVTRSSASTGSCPTPVASIRGSARVCRSRKSRSSSSA